MGGPAYEQAVIGLDNAYIREKDGQQVFYIYSGAFDLRWTILDGDAAVCIRQISLTCNAVGHYVRMIDLTSLEQGEK